MLSSSDLLKPKSVCPEQACTFIPSKPKFMPTFIITYNPHNPELRKWLKEIYFIILSDFKIANIFPHTPSVSSRQSKNMKQIFCHNTLKNLTFIDGSDLGEKPPSTYKHNHGGRGRSCMLFPRLREGRDFSSSYTGISYEMRYHLTYKTRYADMWCTLLHACSVTNSMWA